MDTKEFVGTLESNFDFDLLTEEMESILMASFAVSRGDAGYTDVELQHLLDYVEGTLIEGFLLEMVFEGSLRIDFNEEGLPMYSSTKEEVQKAN